MEFGLLSRDGALLWQQTGPLRFPESEGCPAASPVNCSKVGTAVGGLLFLRNCFLEPTHSLGCWPVVKFGMTWDLSFQA